MNNQFMTYLLDNNCSKVPSPAEIESAIRVDLQNEVVPAGIPDDTHLVNWIDWKASETAYQKWKI